MCNGGFMSGKSIKHLEVLERVKEKIYRKALPLKNLTIQFVKFVEFIKNS